jgi:hypothetical protein
MENFNLNLLIKQILMSTEQSKKTAHRKATYTWLQGGRKQLTAILFPLLRLLLH